MLRIPLRASLLVIIWLRSVSMYSRLWPKTQLHYSMIVDLLKNRFTALTHLPILGETKWNQAFLERKPIPLLGHGAER